MIAITEKTRPTAALASVDILPTKYVTSTRIPLGTWTEALAGFVESAAAPLRADDGYGTRWYSYHGGEWRCTGAYLATLAAYS